MALTESRRTGEFLLSEANGTRSREEVVIAAASGNIAAGTIMAKLTAGGQYVPFAAGGTGGAQTAAGIAHAAIANSAAIQKATVYVRDCEVAGVHLTGLTAPATVTLATLGVIVR